MSDAFGTSSESYTYNQLGQVTQLQKIVGGVTYDVGYNYVGTALTYISYPSGDKAAYYYDAIGRLCGVANTSSYTGCTSMTSPYLTISPTVGYNATNQVTAATYGNGVTASAGYSSTRLQMTSLAYANGSSTLLGLNYYYSYDATYCPTGASGNNGQIQCIKDVSSETSANLRSTNYAYDQLGRLASAATAGGSTPYPAWTASWQYDRYGNRTQQTGTGAAPSPAPVVSTSTNQVTSMGSSGFTYDANGNLTQDDNFKFNMDAANRLISMTTLS
jgi:YD repeat-containing protein